MIATCRRPRDVYAEFGVYHRSRGVLYFVGPPAEKTVRAELERLVEEAYALDRLPGLDSAIPDSTRPPSVG